MDIFRELIPGPAREYVREHPKVLVWTAVALVAFNMWNLVEAVGLYHKAKLVIALHASNAAREASEALGG